MRLRCLWSCSSEPHMSPNASGVVYRFQGTKLWWLWSHFPLHSTKCSCSCMTMQHTNPLGSAGRLVCTDVDWETSPKLKQEEAQQLFCRVCTISPFPSIRFPAQLCRHLCWRGEGAIPEELLVGGTARSRDKNALPWYGCGRTLPRVFPSEGREDLL